MKFLRDYEIFGKPILKAFIVILFWYVIFTILCIVLFLTTDGFNNDKNAELYDKIVDAIYYSTTTFSTIGYGDISPVKSWSKILTSIVQFIIIFITYNVVVEQNKNNIQHAFDEEHKLQGIVDLMQKNNNTNLDNIENISEEKQRWRDIGKNIIIKNQVKKANEIIKNIEENDKISYGKNIIVPINE